MLSPAIADALARFRQEELSDEAERARAGRSTRPRRRHRLPARDGWWMMHARMQVALSAPSAQVQGSSAR
jgi:hypothetical protein